MPSLNTIVSGALAALCVVLALLLQAEHVQHANERTAHATTRAEHAQQLARLADRAVKVRDAVLLSQQRTNAALAAIDKSITKGVSHALEQNRRLRAADADGSRRLRIAATCPAGPAAAANVPSADASPGVDAGTVEVAREVRSAIWDFRAELITDLAKLDHLQQREELKADDAP